MNLIRKMFSFQLKTDILPTTYKRYSDDDKDVEERALLFSKMAAFILDPKRVYLIFCGSGQ